MLQLFDSGKHYFITLVKESTLFNYMLHQTLILFLIYWALDDRNSQL
jgi:hypothetical protein